MAERIVVTMKFQIHMCHGTSFQQLVGHKEMSSATMLSATALELFDQHRPNSSKKTATYQGVFVYMLLLVVHKFKMCFSDFGQGFCQILEIPCQNDHIFSWVGSSIFFWKKSEALDCANISAAAWGSASPVSTCRLHRWMVVLS